jgi:hypothetical protein
VHIHHSRRKEVLIDPHNFAMLSLSIQHVLSSHFLMCPCATTPQKKLHTATIKAGAEATPFQQSVKAKSIIISFLLPTPECVIFRLDKGLW